MIAARQAATDDQVLPDGLLGHQPIREALLSRPLALATALSSAGSPWLSTELLSLTPTALPSRSEYILYLPLLGVSGRNSSGKSNSHNFCLYENRVKHILCVVLASVCAPAFNRPLSCHCVSDVIGIYSHLLPTFDNHTADPTALIPELNCC